MVMQPFLGPVCVASSCWPPGLQPPRLAALEPSSGSSGHFGHMACQRRCGTSELENTGVISVRGFVEDAMYVSAGYVEKQHVSRFLW